MLKTGRRCTWEEIEVGEVFVNKYSDTDGCYDVLFKNNNFGVFDLGSTSDGWLYGLDLSGKTYILHEPSNYDLYKLPQSVQRLWRCDE